MNETQAMLRDMQDRFLSDRYGGESRRAIVASHEGWSAEIWKDLAELGLLGALLPPDHGGLGDVEDVRIVMESFGRALLVEPYISTVIIAGSIFESLGDDARLVSIASGEARFALAHAEGAETDPDQTVATTARADGEGYTLSGEKAVVIDAAAASHLIVSAMLEDSGLALFVVPREADGVIIDAFPLIDGSRGGSLRLVQARVGGDALLCNGNQARDVLRRALRSASVALCCEAIGVMRALLDQTVTYTRERKQFGKPLSSFQVLQHRMADMLVEIEQAESLTLRAVRNPDDAASVASAKIRVNEALRHVAHEAIQLHGGIGTTDELELGQFVRRATAMERLYGTTPRLLAELERIDADVDARTRTQSSGDQHDDFRQEVRDFLDVALTPELRAESDRQAGLFAEPDLAARWQSILFEKGWIAPNWPVEQGGTGWTPRQRLIFERECALANTPVLPAMGLQMCGPVLIGHGTEEQKARFLPSILSGEHRWCQGYSEPGAGSDLAALKTRAVRDGDDYVIDGTKFWTTNAHVSNWMFLLARTDTEVKPQRGITFLLMPMDAPGVSVTPIRSLSGEYEVNQVFLDNVRIPVTNRVGEENHGWTVAKYLLEFERGGGPASARTLRVIGLIRRWMAQMGPIDPGHYRRLTHLEIEVAATEWTQQRMLERIELGGSIGNANASVLKLKAAELFQKSSMLFHDMMGQWGLADQTMRLHAGLPIIGPDLSATGAARYFNSRAISIFGGSSEIQRGILAGQALGL